MNHPIELTQERYSGKPVPENDFVYNTYRFYGSAPFFRNLTDEEGYYDGLIAFAQDLFHPGLIILYLQKDKHLVAVTKKKGSISISGVFEEEYVFPDELLEDMKKDICIFSDEGKMLYVPMISDDLHGVLQIVSNKALFKKDEVATVWTEAKKLVYFIKQSKYYSGAVFDQASGLKNGMAFRNDFVQWSEHYQAFQKDLFLSLIRVYPVRLRNRTENGNIPPPVIHGTSFFDEEKIIGSFTRISKKYLGMYRIASEVVACIGCDVEETIAILREFIFTQEDFGLSASLVIMKGEHPEFVFRTAGELLSAAGVFELRLKNEAVKLK